MHMNYPCPGMIISITENSAQSNLNLSCLFKNQIRPLEFFGSSHCLLRTPNGRACILRMLQCDINSDFHLSHCFCPLYWTKQVPLVQIYLFFHQLLTNNSGDLSQKLNLSLQNSNYFSPLLRQKKIILVIFNFFLIFFCF